MFKCKNTLHTAADFYIYFVHRDMSFIRACAEQLCVCVRVFLQNEQ